MDTIWRIELLGWLRAVQADRIVRRFRRQKTGTLLAYLALYRHSSHPREVLIEQLWPECVPAAGRLNLRVALTSLRHQLEPPGVPAGAVIVADSASVQLNPSACTTDVAQFEAALHSAARVRSSIERGQRLAEAVEIYRGELLPGSYEEWVLRERLRLAEAFCQALHELIALSEQGGDLRKALQWARRAVAADPEREEGHHDLIRLLAAAGQPAAARRQYRELERLLAQELGATPAPEIGEFIRALEARGTGAHHGDVQTRSRPGVGKGARSAPHRMTGETESLPPPGLATTTPSSLPTGTVTFLLIEIVGKRLVEPGGRSGTGLPEHGGALAEGRLDAEQGPHSDGHVEGLRELLRPLCRGCGGQELQTAQAEMLTLAFGRASEALTAAVAAHQAVASGQWLMTSSGLWESDQMPSVSSNHGSLAGCPRSGRCHWFRIALHTGEVEPGGEPQRSAAFPDATRLLRAAHPGQILLSERTAGLLRGDREDGLQLVDLGLYRLRDASPPERLFQARCPEMAPQEFPPPNAPPAHVGRLPLQITRFFGREAEITRLQERLRGASFCRLVTLTGPGGSGKTRLALEVAQRVRKMWHGAVWFVPLADLSGSHLIAEKVADALDLPRSPAVEPFEQVVRALSGQPSLLLLDNFEHLVSEGAPLVQALLERVETLMVLVTSRQRLGLVGEQEFPVAPLPVPQPNRDREGAEGSLAHGRGSALSTLAQCASAALFVDRAQAVRPDFQLAPANAAVVAALCAQLEGLPLAIELAAARAGVLTPAQMLARLEERFELLVSRRRPVAPRHRSMRAALDWSYQLLPPELQRFFVRLSVFRGGFTLDAAAAIADGEVHPQMSQISADRKGRGETGYSFPFSVSSAPSADHDRNAFDCLEQLHACSLVLAEGPDARRKPQADEPDLAPNTPLLVPTGLRPSPGEAEMRYRLLETLREYSAEQLAPQERATVACRHAQFFLALAEDAEPALLGPEQKEWMDRLEQEHDNLRAALAWAWESGAAELGLRLAGALWRFWFARGYLAEGRKWLAALLVLGGDAGCQPPAAREDSSESSPTEGSHRSPRSLCLQAARAKALGAAGILGMHHGDNEATHSLFEQSLALSREVGDQRGIALALGHLGFWAYRHDVRATGRALLAESLALFAGLEDPWGMAFALGFLGELVACEGDTAGARARYAESLRLFREVGDQGSIATLLLALGNLACARGDQAEARALFGESREIYQELGDKQGLASALQGLGKSARKEDDQESARSLLQESLRLFREAGAACGIVCSLSQLGLLAQHQGDWTGARTLFEESLALHRTLGVKENIADALRSLGNVTRAQGDWPATRTLYAESLVLHEQLGDRCGMAECVEGLAAAAGGSGHPGHAARLLGAAEALRDAIAAPFPLVAYALNGPPEAASGGDAAASERASRR